MSILTTSYLPDKKTLVSRLGFGCMRLPLLNSDDPSSIDKIEASKMLRHAIDKGLSYVDTAYGYHGGLSESFVGEALKNGYRDKVCLATKLPAFLIESKEDMDRIFNEQLDRLQVEYVDVYLLHALNQNLFEKMRKFNYKDFLNRLKSEGKIKYFGFSFHDDFEVFKDIIDDFDWDVTQIQLNILDEEYQAGLKGLEYATSKGISTIIMEPLRGGALANPPQEVKAMYDSFIPHRSSVEWSFRYLYDKPNIMTILSGMSTMEQVKDNLRIFKSAEPNSLTNEENLLLEKIKNMFKNRMVTKCTGCDYCQDCPEGIKISGIFQNYDYFNMLDKMGDWKNFYQRFIDDNTHGGKCIECYNCESVCPQHLSIVSLLDSIHSEYK